MGKFAAADRPSCVWVQTHRPDLKGAPVCGCRGRNLRRHRQSPPPPARFCLDIAAPAPPIWDDASNAIGPTSMETFPSAALWFVVSQSSRHLSFYSAPEGVEDD